MAHVTSPVPAKAENWKQMFQQAQIDALQNVATTADRLTYGEAALRHYVEQARRAGASWARIGSILGMTGAGARQRFAPKRRPQVAGAVRLF